MSKKVLLYRLFRPAFEMTIVPPLGIMYLASTLRSWGNHDVAIYDMKIEGNDIKRATKFAEEFNPDVIGMSMMSFESPVLKELTQSLRAVLPDAFYLAGGAHPSTFPEDIVKHPDIDLFVVGEGEKTMQTIMERLEGGGRLDNIEGTSVCIDGEAVSHKKESYIDDLDSLPMPAWDLIPVQKYFNLPRMGNIFMHKEYMPMFTSRSCPYSCVYCHLVFGKGFRQRSADSIVDEMKYLKKTYNIREILILDDIFNLRKKDCSKILDKIIESDLDMCLRFPNGMRADLLDRDMLIKFKQANTFATCVAVETAVPRIQKMIKKRAKVDKIFEVIRQADEIGIMTHGFFMIGFPTETKEEMQQTVDYAVNSKLHSAAMLRVTPFKGTALYTMAKEMGFDIPDDPDHFQLYNTNFNLSAEPKEVLDKMQKSFYRRFYMDPVRQFRYMKILPNKFATLPRLLGIFMSRAFGY